MSLNNKFIKATKWSTITEIIAKLILPITNMVLVRILAPEAFGAVATITMVISFTEIFTDAGFQKYLVQHEFKDENDKILATNVAFWTNFIISLILWILIILFSDEIAMMLGSDGLGPAIAIASIQLPITSFSSIQMAIYRRNFDFKTLFIVRIVGVFIPFFITIPIAILGYNYWALIIGNICGNLVNSVILTLKSNWKPKLMYKFLTFKKMISFSIWSLIESISIWLTIWIDAFIIGRFLNEYYLGLYKSSTSMVNSIMAIVTASITPVLFSSLSRLQNKEDSFKTIFYNVQKYVAYLVFPMAIGGYVYRDFITKIFLGDKWSEASNIIGIWILTSAIVIVFSNFNSEVYRAKGKPKLSFISQVAHLIFLIPTCIVSLNYGFWTFIYARSLIRIQGVFVGLIIMGNIMKFSIKKILVSSIKPGISSIIMGIVALNLRKFSNSVIWNITSIFICIIVYLIISLILIYRKSIDIKITIKKRIIVYLIMALKLVSKDFIDIKITIKKKDKNVSL